MLMKHLTGQKNSSLNRTISVATTPGCKELAVTPVPVKHIYCMKYNITEMLTLIMLIITFEISTSLPPTFKGGFRGSTPPPKMCQA